MNDVPKGWIEVPLMNFIHYLSTGVTQYTDEKEYYSTGSIKNSSYIPEGKFTFGNRPSRANRLSKIGDVFQARMKGTDKGLIINQNLNDKLFSTGFIQLKPIAKTYSSKLLYYFVKSKLFIDQRDELATGSTQEALTDRNAKELKLLVPPTNEQKKIVEKLDKLLVKVEETKERLDKIPTILKRFRQSVLNAAVTGELTKDWRDDSNKVEEWEEACLSDVADLRLGKMLDKSKNKGEKTAYLRNINVRWFSFDLYDIAELRITSKEKKILDIINGDLFVCEGGEPGRCAVWVNGKTNLTFQKAIHRVRVKKNVQPKWVAFNLKKDADTQMLEEYFTGTTIKHITGQSLKKYSFKLPPLDEQKEIIKRVEALFKFADEIEERYKKAKAYIDKLTQSILAKAFRGELVPQDPNDEPAEKLLERIKEEREKMELTKQRKGRRGK